MFSFSLVKAQEVSFVVNKNRDQVINLVFKLQSSLSKGEVFDTIKDDRLFTTGIRIKDEIYLSNDRKNYLNVKYINRPSKAIISSFWLISLIKLSPTKTKVSSTLISVTPNESNKNNIDAEETISTGKFEKQLRDLLEKK